tara:strand:+ start:202 stop:483 length:282 start_codon:yes stop_codon:yes gene_type:complete
MSRVKIMFPGDDPRWNYVRGAFPKTKTEARECWEQISWSLSPENLAEDGMLSSREQVRKEREIHEDARLLFKHFKCPKDITSDGDIEQYMEGV